MNTATDTRNTTAGNAPGPNAFVGYVFSSSRDCPIPEVRMTHSAGEGHKGRSRKPWEFGIPVKNHRMEFIPGGEAPAADASPFTRPAFEIEPGDTILSVHPITGEAEPTVVLTKTTGLLFTNFTLANGRGRLVASPHTQVLVPAMSK